MSMPILALYIDPGTGSMLFTILVGVLGAGIYAARDGLMKLRFFLSGGRGARPSEERLPVAIFSESKRYWNVFGPICEEFERRGVELHYLTASPDDPALERQFRHVRCRFIGEGDKAYAKLGLLKADVLLATTPGLEVYQWKRSKNVGSYVHIPHACSDVTLYHMFGLDYYDAVLLSGDYEIRQLEELEQLRGLPAKDKVVVGVTYMDAMRERLQRAEPLPSHPTTVLLAPSWGESAILSRFGGKILDALLQSGYHVIVRPHPQSFTAEKELMERLMREYPNSERLEWDRSNDNFETLRRSDLMISDFSGVIFDFSLVFDKPVIYADTAFDPAPYDACWLDEQPWTFSALPRIGEKLTEESFPRLRELIEQCLTEPRFQEGREQARAETWAHIGEAASRVADDLIARRERLLKQAADANDAGDRGSRRTAVKGGSEA